MNLLNHEPSKYIMIATIWEVWNDRLGDLNKTADIQVRFLLLLIEAVLLYLLTDKNIFICINLSIAFFFLTFDYAINYILIKNGTLELPRGVKYHWFDYSGKKGVIDNLKFWKNLNPYVKLLIRVTYFVGSLVLYFMI